MLNFDLIYNYNFEITNLKKRLFSKSKTKLNTITRQKKQENINI